MESLSKSPITPNPLPATTLSAESCVSIAVVPKLKRAFNFDTDVICVFLGKGGEHCTEYKQLQWSKVRMLK